jgi:iron complex outermembrane receptor protein
MLAGGAAAIAEPALAQAAADSRVDSTAATSASDVDEVVVTARRREERLRDVPTAGDVVDQRSIAEQGGLVTLQDLIATAPSINFANTSTPQTAEISIRGSGTARATNAEAAVGLYRNGTYIGGGRIGGRTFTRMDFFDVERAEVLRGVQGALFGRNAVGGAINLITAAPAFEHTGYVIGRYATHDRKELQLVENFELVPGVVAARIGFDFQDQPEGFFYNPVRDEHFDEQHAEGYRAQLRWRTDRGNLNILAERSLADLPALNFQIFIPVGTPGFPNGAFAPQYEYRWNGPKGAKQNQESYIAELDYDLGFANLSAVASLRTRETIHAFDADGVDPVFLAELRRNGGGLATDPNQGQEQADDTEIQYLEAHLTDKGVGRLRWLVGIERVTIASDSLFTVTRTPTAANPSPGTISPATLETDSTAVFGSVGYDLSDQLNLTLEARYTEDEKSLIASRVDARTGASAGAQFSINSDSAEDNLSYTATVAQKLPRWDGLLYAKLGTAYRAGGFNTDLGDPRAPRPVPPSYSNETSTAYEIGLKGDLLPSVFATLAIYQTDSKDVLVQDTNGCMLTNPICPTANTPFLRNGGDARSRGIELQANGRFRIGTGLLKVSGGISRLDAEITSGADAGRRVPQVPDWLVSSVVNYTAPVAYGADGFVNVVYSSRSGGVQEIAQIPPLRDFELVDLRFGVRKAGWEFALFADNLLDERYIVNSIPTSQRWNIPRVVGAEVSRRW